ncbi:MAG: helix-turn-helix domain-containing protein [Aggregatilineales bacterium]
MYKYGQYCPVAQALELIGDRWTLLIIRDMLTDTRHFNDLVRGLPGISRALLAKRLKQLEEADIVEKRVNETGRQTTAYHLTQSGQELNGVITALMLWGADWAFSDPTMEQLDPLLLMWWIHNRVRTEQLPQERITIQFDFYGAETATYWLVLTQKDATICLTDPGYEINVLITADLATFFKVWLGRIEFAEALESGEVKIDGIPRLTRGFPEWFMWSPASPAIRATRAKSA